MALDLEIGQADYTNSDAPFRTPVDDNQASLSLQDNSAVSKFDAIVAQANTGENTVDNSPNPLDPGILSDYIGQEVILEIRTKEGSTNLAVVELGSVTPSLAIDGIFNITINNHNRVASQRVLDDRSANEPDIDIYQGALQLTLSKNNTHHLTGALNDILTRVSPFNPDDAIVAGPTTGEGTQDSSINPLDPNVLSEHIGQEVLLKLRTDEGAFKFAVVEIGSVTSSPAIPGSYNVTFSDHNRDASQRALDGFFEEQAIREDSTADRIRQRSAPITHPATGRAIESGSIGVYHGPDSMPFSANNTNSSGSLNNILIDVLPWNPGVAE